MKSISGAPTFSLNRPEVNTDLVASPLSSFISCFRSLLVISGATSPSPVDSIVSFPINVSNWFCVVTAIGSQNLGCGSAPLYNRNRYLARCFAYRLLYRMFVGLQFSVVLQAMSQIGSVLPLLYKCRWLTPWLWVSSLVWYKPSSTPLFCLSSSLWCFWYCNFQWLGAILFDISRFVTVLTDCGGSCSKICAIFCSSFSCP